MHEHEAEINLVFHDYQTMFLPFRITSGFLKRLHLRSNLQKTVPLHHNQKVAKTDEEDLVEILTNFE